MEGDENSLSEDQSESIREKCEKEENEEMTDVEEIDSGADKEGKSNEAITESAPDLVAAEPSISMPEEGHGTENPKDRKDSSEKATLEQRLPDTEEMDVAGEELVEVVVETCREVAPNKEEDLSNVKSSGTVLQIFFSIYISLELCIYNV